MYTNYNLRCLRFELKRMPYKMRYVVLYTHTDFFLIQQYLCAYVDRKISFYDVFILCLYTCIIDGRQLTEKLFQLVGRNKNLQ